MHQNELALAQLDFPTAHAQNDGDIRINDFRIVAGLLFRRWNDSIERFGIFHQDRGTSTVHLMNDTEERIIPVLSVAFMSLMRNGHAKAYFGRPALIVLNNKGESMVVNEWFKKSASVLDHLAAVRELEQA
ncbi:MAG: hypothetical protein RL538_841 [Candidatus Parcubacteria bacterium]|jgi:hypothetical protein